MEQEDRVVLCCRSADKFRWFVRRMKIPGAQPQRKGKGEQQIRKRGASAEKGNYWNQS